MGVGLIIGSVLISSHPPIDTKNENTNSTNENLFLNAIQPEIPDTVYFANERVPIEYYDVYESLDLEMIVNTYRHSATILYIKRAERYFPIIEPILKENGIPDDFKYLCVAESGLTNAVSPARAEGFWQFLKATGLEHKMEINNYIDQRYNLEISTKAACDYLNKAYKRFGNWTLAAVSYNMGMGGLSRRINHQKVEEYWDLYLHQEPARYVYRIISFKIIMENPEKYGFFIPENHRYKAFDYQEVIVDSTINNLPEFAAKYGINYKLLRMHNPWIRDTFLQNKSGRTYVLTIPKPEDRLRSR
ncbi:MAG: lytic transglycosylase domain-containing protein [Bacteroidales bacterium]|nr:lytic transglycosylase domain-containing protein [Bacteroidales bacterium]